MTKPYLRLALEFCHSPTQSCHDIFAKTQTKAITLSFSKFTLRLALQLCQNPIQDCHKILLNALPKVVTKFLSWSYPKLVKALPMIFRRSLSYFFYMLIKVLPKVITRFLSWSYPKLVKAVPKAVTTSFLTPYPRLSQHPSQNPL